MLLTEEYHRAVHHIAAVHHTEPGGRLALGQLLIREGWRYRRQPLDGIRGAAVLDGPVKLLLIEERVPLVERRVTAAWLYAQSLLGRQGWVVMSELDLTWGPSHVPPGRGPAELAARLLIPDAVLATTDSLATLRRVCAVTPALLSVRLRFLPQAEAARFWTNAREWRVVRPDERPAG